MATRWFIWAQWSLAERQVGSSAQKEAIIHAKGAVGLVILLLAGCATTGETAQPSEATRPSTAAESSATAEPTPIEDPAAAILAQCDEAPAPAGEPVELTIGATSSGFDTDRLEGPRHCEPFTITFANADSGVAHNVSISPTDQILVTLFWEDPLEGPRTVTYEVPGLPAGDYLFVCGPHRETMRGTLVVSEL